MANEQNLIPNNQRSPSEVRKNGAKGGIKSGEVRRQNRTFKEIFNQISNSEVKNERLKEMISNNYGIEDKELTNNVAVAIGIYNKAIRGNVQAYKEIKELEDKQENKKEHTNIFIPAKNIAKSFIDIYRDIMNRQHREYWLEGGRGSTKSSFVSEMIIELLDNNEDMCAIVIRRLQNTLKDSVYAQVDWAVQELGDCFKDLPEEWKFKKSPLEVVNTRTNQRIYFRGTDDPTSIKSIKPPKGKYLAIIWYEEFDQIQGMNAVRKINQSIVRGGEDFIQFYTYNTPPSRQHFVNKEKRMPKKTRLVHLSDYRSVPKEWLGQAFIDEAEYVKETAPIIYENEYLGLETGDGGNVFENLEIREITDEEISHFDRLYRGLDWGWYPDPFAYNCMHFDAARRTLYIFDELRCNKTSNADTWKRLQEEKGVTNQDLITADSAENKSIGDYKSYGAFIRGAEKGPHSVEYSMKWLASLNKIIIDPVRCPNTATEFAEYELEKDKDGNIITGYPDKNNHHIDAVRYRTRKYMEKTWKIIVDFPLNY